MKTSGPAGPSRNTTTVAAGRAFAAITRHILVDDALVLGDGSERPVAALLRDFAAIQKSKQRMWGYKRAAAAIPSDRVINWWPRERLLEWARSRSG
jgi:hypothetical protein